MLTVKVEDIVIATRTVELPDACPGCGVALNEANLTGYEYQDQSRSVVVRETDELDYDENGGDLPQSGESYIGWLHISCECGYVLAEGSEKRVEEK